MGLKMKGSVLDELVKRLRSGEYAQGTGALRVRAASGRDLYCCLGVMCEMAVEDGVIERKSNSDVGSAYSYSSGMGEYEYNAYLPPAVIDWAGILSDVEKSLTYEDYHYHYEERGQWGDGGDDALAVMNDARMPFPEIADWLVANVERV